VQVLDYTTLANPYLYLTYRKVTLTYLPALAQSSEEKCSTKNRGESRNSCNSRSGIGETAL
jgi:hypothetical protein